MFFSVFEVFSNLGMNFPGLLFNVSFRTIARDTFSLTNSWLALRRYALKLIPVRFAFAKASFLTSHQF